MGKVGNVPTDIQDGIQDALGHKMKISFARKVSYEVKPDKFDDRVLALNDHRVFIFTPKIPMKLETSLHFLDINLLESKSPQKMVIGTELKRHMMISNSQDQSTDEFDRAVGHIIVSLAKVFPNVPPDKLIAKVDFAPPSRLQDFRRIGADIGLRDEGPCGNFSTMYRYMCGYHNMDVQEDVAWDVDMIYLSQDSKEMNLKDFDHLDNRHLIPIISALEHNTWFTRLNTSNVKLSPEAINEILKIMKTNTAIEELVLANINVPTDFCQRLCMSLVANTGSPLTTLDLSGNIIGDRGLNHLFAPITKLSRGLVELNLARTGITARGVNKLSEALLSNRNIPLNLRILDLSENSFKGEDVPNLFNFFAQPNVLTDLRLAATECSLESLFAALQRGCAQNLANLDVSNNFFSYKKQGKDVSVPSSWKQFFASAISLKNINFSGSRLPPEALRSILEGIGSNPSLTDVELNLSSNGFGLPGNQGGHILETHLCSIRNVSHLDLSDNGFDIGLANILEKLNQNKSLRKLSIGRNLNNIKPKNVPHIIEAVIQLIHQENSPIRCLNVDNLRLKTETVLLINALGTNDTLTEIDISGNQMGDIGSRMLSKALQINKRLCIIYWDHNGTSPNGFQDIAAALEKNFTLHKMPMPINDAVQALRINQEKTEQALKKIESVLQRNHSNKKMHKNNTCRLQQCFMINTLKQTMEVHLAHLQETIGKYENLQQKYQLSISNSSAQDEVTKALTLLKEADSAKTLFLQLQRIVEESECKSSLQKNLNSLGSGLCDVVTKQLKANISAMIACAEEQFPVTLKNETLQEELTSSERNCQLSVEFVQNLMSDQLSADVANKTSELNLLAASHISECILEEIINEVEKSAQSLKSLLNSARSQLLLNGQLKDEDAESKEHRETLKRHKPSVTTDEDLDAATDMPSISNKHKSQLNRRLRPQSSVEASVDHDTGKSLEGKAAESSVHSNGADLFSSSDDVSAPKLKHLAKSRPRRPKNNAVTRPIAFDPVIDESDVCRGFSEFFAAKPLLPAERRENGELTVHEISDEGVKSEMLNKKEKSKATAFSPKLESKGFASNLANRFKKKPSESEMSQLPQQSSGDLAIPNSSPTLQKNEEKLSDSGDNLRPSEGAIKIETEEPSESRPKQPPGVAKIRLPGMSGGIDLEELRRKKAAAKHVPNLTEGSEEKGIQSPEKKSSQPKDAGELPSAEDSTSGTSSHLSVSAKVRLPPPLAPKPSKRASTGASASTSTPSSGGTAATDAPKPEAEDTPQEPEQKTDVHQGTDAAAFDRKKRFSVREKAASIDKNSNLKSEGSSSNKKPVTQTAEDSAKSPESLVHLLSSDGSVDQASPSSSATGPESEASVLPSDLPCDADNDGDVKSNAAAKRLSNIDLIDT